MTDGEYGSPVTVVIMCACTMATKAFHMTQSRPVDAGGIGMYNKAFRAQINISRRLIHIGRWVPCSDDGSTSIQRTQLGSELAVNRPNEPMWKSLTRLRNPGYALRLVAMYRS